MWEAHGVGGWGLQAARFQWAVKVKAGVAGWKSLWGREGRARGASNATRRDRFLSHRWRCPGSPELAT